MKKQMKNKLLRKILAGKNSGVEGPNLLKARLLVGVSEPIIVPGSISPRPLGHVDKPDAKFPIKPKKALFPCDYRGEKVGIVNCGCNPDIDTILYSCKCEEQETDYCVEIGLGIQMKSLKLESGIIDDKLQSCNKCPFRKNIIT